MIGKVIDGRYAGSGVYKFPDNNVLVIQIPDGEKIALSKDNILSIENVTAQYSPTSNNTIMVMWNDFETSFIQLGVQSNSGTNLSETNSRTVRPNNQKNERKHSQENITNKSYYLGEQIISEDEVLQIMELISKNERLKAITQVKEIAGIGLSDAKYIIDNFETLDLTKPQSTFISSTSNNSASEKPNVHKQNNPSKNNGCSLWIIVFVFLFLLGSCSKGCNNGSNNKYGYGYEECFRCHGAGMVNEGFLDFKTCPTCRGSGMLDSH